MKYILPVSIIFLVIHLYISFFVVSQCTLNDGIAFGISLPYIEWISVGLLVVLFLIFMKTKSSMKYILLGITILGAANVLERVFRGYICDYIPMFSIYVNVADIGITTLAVLGVIICIFKRDGYRNKRER